MEAQMSTIELLEPKMSSNSSSSTNSDEIEASPINQQSSNSSCEISCGADNPVIVIGMKKKISEEIYQSLFFDMRRQNIFVSA